MIWEDLEEGKEEESNEKKLGAFGGEVKNLSQEKIPGVY